MPVYNERLTLEKIVQMVLAAPLSIELDLRSNQVTCLVEGDAPREERDIAVTIDESSSAQRLSLFARCAGLSVREAELLGHLATGADTRAVAARMFLSPHTVQDHLKSVFAKTGTRSRRTLLARALGG